MAVDEKAAAVADKGEVPANNLVEHPPTIMCRTTMNYGIRHIIPHRGPQQQQKVVVAEEGALDRRPWDPAVVAGVANDRREEVSLAIITVVV